MWGDQVGRQVVSMERVDLQRSMSAGRSTHILKPLTLDPDL